jgi:hypothetical protein
MSEVVVDYLIIVDLMFFKVTGPYDYLDVSSALMKIGLTPNGQINEHQKEFPFKLKLCN